RTPMASATAVAFVLLGLSLVCARMRGLAALHQTFACLSMLFGWLGFSRYVFGGSGGVMFTNMALQTCILLVLTSTGALTLRTDVGIAKLLASEGVGGAMARRLLPAAILAPLAAGALALQAERSGVLGYETAVSVFALAAVIVFAAFVLINAERGERADDSRRRA